MLAASHRQIDDDVVKALEKLHAMNAYTFDEKLDGIRAMAYIDDGCVRLFNRREVDITDRYPDVVDCLQKRFADETYVFDGEIVVLNEDGFSDFAATHRRDAQQNPSAIRRWTEETPATFISFDMLRRGVHEDIRSLTFKTRRIMMRQITDTDVARCNTNGMDMWEHVKQHGLEGLIAKRLTSIYTGGRSNAWIKLKLSQRISALVVGYTPGEGSRKGQIGALTLALLDGRKIVGVGSVGSGFSVDDMRVCIELLNKNQPFIVDVEIQGLTSGQQLRGPSFKGVRNDLELDACTMAQIENAKDPQYR